MTALTHIPVLLNEVLGALAVRPGGLYIDGTLGRAGHTTAILKQGGRVLGIDRDAAALDAVHDLQANDARGLYAALCACKGRHGDIQQLACAHGFEQVDGILLDLGVSSPQLDEGERGFSFRADGPLDMRMDTSCGETAADVVNTLGVDELAELFRTYGEEREAYRVAKAIVAARVTKAFARTGELAELVARVIGWHGPHHPATRVFQALRMRVNDEMGELKRALAGGLALLKKDGRFVVITFESLTDRVVKQFFAEHAGRYVSLQEGGRKWEGQTPRVRLVTRHAVTAGPEETARNARSRSAKMRAAERISDEETE